MNKQLQLLVSLKMQ